MNLSEYSKLDGVALADLVRTKQVTASELATLAAAAVQSVNGELNAVIALHQDRLDDPTSLRYPEGVLNGVPILNKDLTPEEGSLLEMGSELTRGYVSPFTCDFLKNLTAAGTNNIGRTTTPEFGLASVTESLIAGVTRNPWDLARTPGGSSGGSAAMVAAGAIPIATGSDGGGSIRSPAAHCGIVGLKPTRGRISQGPLPDEPVYGLAVHFVLTRSVRDSAVALDATHGMAPGDAYGIQKPETPYANSLQPPKKRLRIGYTTTSWGGQAADADAREGTLKALRLLEAQGHIIEEARPEFAEERLGRATLDLWCANTAFALDEIGAHLGRVPGPDNMQSATLSFYRHGLAVSRTDILSALGVFNEVNLSVGHFFRQYDLFVTPTCMGAAPLIGDVKCNPDGVIDAAAWSQKMNAIDAFMPLFNTTGHPAISLPLHWTDEGLPIGVQFVAPFADETTLFQLAALFEEELPWRHRRPRINVGRSTQEP